MKALVIVESPTKAKTIRKFLPKNFVVEASMGHVRDLPATAAAIPAKLKTEAWSRLGVNTEGDFEPIYVIPKGKSKIVSGLRKLIKNADVLYLATDEDREGESISWHLIQLLKPKIPVKRMVFHEITKKAINAALENCRDLDLSLVSAQETRRVLDRLFGYTLSPLIWKKVAYGLSAGRVQSVGLRLIVDKERERIKFVKAEYWDLEASLAIQKKAFPSKIISWKGEFIAGGKDFDEYTGKLKKTKSDRKILHLKKDDAEKLKKELETKEWKVVSVEEKPFQSNPAIPFITSTLQQEGSRKLGMSSRETMRTAQRLYENGLITYMRTDSPTLSSQAIQAARSCVEDLYGKEFLSKAPRQYSAKQKGAQEAHEAIRPSGEKFVHPSKTGLGGKEAALYDLIWKRTVATQMAEAKKSSTQIRIESGEALFSASGTRIVFPGFLRAYVEGSDDPDAALGDKEVILPELKKGDLLSLEELKSLEHATKAKARFTEASLIKILEKEGIGRPSTYASIIDTITNRGYVRRVGNSLIPTYTGFAVIQILEKHFENLVDPQFTAKMENALDEIAEGDLESLPYLKDFYLGAKGLAKQVEKKDKLIDPKESRVISLKSLGEIEVRVGRFGAYLTHEEVNATVPLDIAPADLNAEKAEEIIAISKEGPISIGVDPKSKEKVYVLLGRFGPYVQLGEVSDEVPKPRRASVPKEVHPDQVEIEQALVWLSLPRDLGMHPETKKEILANNGRFGPYVVHDGDFRSLKKEDDVYKVTLERALELLAEEKKGRRGSKLLKDFGMHPKKNKKINLYEGKYGAYLKMGTKNFGLPDGTKVEELTLEKAVEIIDPQNGSKTKVVKKKSTKKKTTKKKATKKKTTKKKKTKK